MSVVASIALAQGLGQGGWLRPDLLVSLGLATVLGAVVGWEREVNDKPAGLRTTILICVGAALFTDLSIQVGGLAELADPGRIAAQVVTGVGFLGAGTIIQSRGSITGLTTAATIWVVSAIGVAAGAQAYVEATGTTVLVLLVLAPLTRLEGYARTRRRVRTLRVSATSVEAVETVLEVLGAAGLEPARPVWGKEPQDQSLTVSVRVFGDEKAFREARERLARREDMRGLRVT